MALLIAAAIIAPLVRVALRREEPHLPDQAQDHPLQYSESAQSLLLYIIGLDRQMQEVQRENKEILDMLRAPDGGSYLHKINDGITLLNVLMRKRASRRRGSE